MPRYYDMDKLAEILQAKADTLIEGKEAFLCVAKWLDKLPPADVAPKTEVEALQEMLDATIAGQETLQKSLANAKSEVDGFPCVAYNKKHERYQVIHKGKDGRIFASKLYYTRKDAEKALAELKKKYTEGKDG